MSKATHAILKHYSSTPEQPKHDDCPAGPTSWCSYQRDQANGTNLHKPIKDAFPDAVVEVMQPLFDRLGNEAFLVGCESCQTQNRNECLHHVIWGMASKEMFSSPQEISIAVSLGVLQFNQGFSATYTELLPQLDIQVQPKVQEIWRKIDFDRIYQSDYRSTPMVQKRQKKKRKEKMKKQDAFVRKDGGPVYQSHGFYAGENASGARKKGKTKVASKRKEKSSGQTTKKSLQKTKSRKSGQTRKKSSSQKVKKSKPSRKK